MLYADIPPAPPAALVHWTSSEQPRRAPFTGRRPLERGALDGQAIFLPEAPYPPGARAAGARGSVRVRVTIDENGRVIDARAVSGHPLLRDAAVGAARRGRFQPPMLSGQSIKVTGTIVITPVLDRK